MKMPAIYLLLTIGALIPAVESGLPPSGTVAPDHSWQQIGGPQGGFSVFDPQLREDWTGAEATVAWRTRLTGPAAARGVSIADGLVFVVDNDAEGRNAILRALGLGDGQERWRCAWPTGGPLKGVIPIHFQRHNNQHAGRRRSACVLGSPSPQIPPRFCGRL